MTARTLVVRDFQQVGAVPKAALYTVPAAQPNPSSTRLDSCTPKHTNTRPHETEKRNALAHPLSCTPTHSANARTHARTHARARARAQALRYARHRASRGALLPAADADGRYGTAFWDGVAARVPGRTPAECLDAFLAVRQEAVARFTAAVRRP